MKNNNWTFKDKLEIWEAIFTIIVSLMAIGGSVAAWENGFWYKLKHVVEHLHEEYVIKEINNGQKLGIENPSNK